MFETRSNCFHDGMLQGSIIHAIFWKLKDFQDDFFFELMFKILSKIFWHIIIKVSIIVAAGVACVFLVGCCFNGMLKNEFNRGFIITFQRKPKCVVIGQLVKLHFLFTVDDILCDIEFVTRNQNWMFINFLVDEMLEEPKQTRMPSRALSPRGDLLSDGLVNVFALKYVTMMMYCCFVEKSSPDVGNDAVLVDGLVPRRGDASVNQRRLRGAGCVGDDFARERNLLEEAARAGDGQLGVVGVREVRDEVGDLGLLLDVEDGIEFFLFFSAFLIFVVGGTGGLGGEEIEEGVCCKWFVLLILIEVEVHFDSFFLFLFWYNNRIGMKTDVHFKKC